MPKLDPRSIVSRYEQNPILTPEMVPYPCNSVFNTAATLHDGKTVLLFRVEDLEGISHLGLATSADGLTDWQIHQEPVLSPDPDSVYEERGVEDPRVTRIGETYYVTYTGWSRFGPTVGLAMTHDFLDYERIGVIALPENKDAALYPKKFDGHFALLNRPVPEMEGAAHMWLSFSPDLIHWGQHQCVMMARERGRWDSLKIGAGAPPVETEKGWLEVYHGVKLSVNTDIYRLGLALFDKENPARLIGRSPVPFLGPVEMDERTGDVPNVTFSCGVTVVDGEMRIYYGAGDSAVSVCTAKVDDLLSLIVETDQLDRI